MLLEQLTKVGEISREQYEGKVFLLSDSLGLFDEDVPTPVFSALWKFELILPDFIFFRTLI